MYISIILKSLDINITFGIIRNPFLDKDDYREAISNKIATKQLPVTEKNLLPADTMNRIGKTYQNEFIDWKIKMERDFRDWIEKLEFPPEIECLDETPDIYSFYEELSVLTNEMRRGNRKSSESLSSFDNSMEEFSKSVNEIKEHLAVLESNNSNQRPTNQKQLIMSLVEITERINRMEKALVVTPKKGIFGHSNGWKEAFENIKKGISILVSHMESLLQKEGVERTKTVGNQFDPARMIAVAAETVRDIPDNFVAEEISPGYMLNKNVLKFAEVKVSTRKEKK